MWFECLIGAEHENIGYGGEYDNIGRCGPIWVMNEPNIQKGSLSSSDRIDAKFERKISKSWIEDMARTNSGMSCLFGRV